MSDTRLKSFVDRIEKVEADQRDRGADKRAVYDEVKEAGYNAKALRKLIAERRQKDRDEINEAMDGYRVALGMAVKAVRDGMSLNGASEEYGFSRSAIHRASHCEENAVSGTGREMIADDLGDPLLIRLKVRAFAESVRVAAPGRTQDEDDLAFPTFLDRRDELQKSRPVPDGTYK